MFVNCLNAVHGYNGNPNHSCQTQGHQAHISIEIRLCNVASYTCWFWLVPVSHVDTMVTPIW